MKAKRGIDFVKDILGQGRCSFTLDEASQAIGQRGQTLNMTLQRLKHDKWVVPFSQGFYLALDVQHQPAGMLDPEWFVDEWARFLGVEYYVGGLSAAALHGAAHQHPIAFQVFLNRVVRSVNKGGLRVDVFYKRAIPSAAVERRKCPAGYFRISNPELTAYDLIAYERCCPSVDLAATVYVELGEAIDSVRLAALREQGARDAELQRVGWLLDQMGWKEKTTSLHEALSQSHLVWRALDRRLPASGERNDHWKVLVNTDVQPDIER